MKLTFHGAARTVTGSRHLLETGGQRVLVDCGLFQGLKKLRLLNWEPPGFEPGFLDHVVLTHAHIDHTGYVPRLMQYGFNGDIHCTRATAELIDLMLLDAAHIQEEDAAFANKKGFSKHRPAEPLYTTVHALQALKLLKSWRFGQWVKLSSRLRFRLVNAGHILGAACVEFRLAETMPGSVHPEEITVVFSGDLGRFDVPLHSNPDALPDCDVLIVESTYGDRRHDKTPVVDQIRREFKRTIHKKGVVLIPSFAIARTQLVTLILRDLMREGELEEVPIHIDSPMAIDATEIYSRHLYDCKLDEETAWDGRTRLFPFKVHLHRTVHESKMLNSMSGPRVIIAASGMMTGGRILHHLVRRLPDHRNLLLLTGYQGIGTRGRALQDGAQTLRMHGRSIDVEARVSTIQGLSSHADADEIMTWIKSAGRKPGRVFVVHGEENSANALAARITKETGARTTIPDLGDSFEF